MKRYKIKLILEDRENHSTSSIDYQTDKKESIVKDLRRKATLLQKTGLVIEEMNWD